MQLSQYTFAENEVELSFNEISSSHEEMTVTLEMNAKNLKDVVSGRLVLNYDTKIIALDGEVEVSNMFSSVNAMTLLRNDGNGEIIFAFAHTGSSSLRDGNIFTFKFNIISTEKEKGLISIDESRTYFLDTDGNRLGCSLLNYEVSTKFYRVIFMDSVTYKIIETKYVQADKAVIPPEVPVHEGYKFLGWDGDLSSIVSDILICAKYRPLETFTVTFIDKDTGEVLDVQQVIEDSSAVPPEIEAPDGMVTYWSDDIYCVTHDMEVFYDFTIRGDVNVDGIVDSADATEVLRFVASLAVPNFQGRPAIDMNADGEYDSADATAILRFVAGLE